MLDIRLIRENPDLVRKNLEKRHDLQKITLLETVIQKDADWRKLSNETDSLKSQRNKFSQQIATLKRKKQDASKQIEEMQKLNAKILETETKVNEAFNTIKQGLMKIPNLLHESVPFGKDDTENIEIKTWGKQNFDFQANNHFDILKNLDLIDQENANKVSGHGFFYLKNELALLDISLLRFGLDFLAKKGFDIIETPFMMRKEPYKGVTDLSDFEDVLYKIEGEDLYLIATSEHPMAAMFMDEVLDKSQLPIKFVGVSPCFRKEVGAHGKYTKGLFRMHQFNKVEQFIFCLPEQSQKFHEELQKNAEQLYQSLGLPYRVMNVCTGDIGDIAAKKYDTDLWMADGKFREAGSNSNCTDYQARGLNIKYREKQGAPPKEFVHTLNNTAIATSRTILAILEVHQQQDGSVKIPKALLPYMGKSE
ncbi:MAG: serine--tRNA ligase, partial [Candidatus Diapherotrites archaeon]|nr:serine--tRNA ligase [Candidatus Diapherotrites archaeon]